MRIAVLAALLVALAGCSTSVAGTPSADPVALKTVTASANANRQVCVDFDARGGELYEVFVIPMMAGASGSKSISVDAVRLAHATASLTSLGAGSLADATGDVQDAGQRVVASAEALGIYNNAEGTALLTAFVSLGVACTKADLKPSWFDPNALATS